MLFRFLLPAELYQGIHNFTLSQGKCTQSHAGFQAFYQFLDYL